MTLRFTGGKWKPVIRPLAAGNKRYHEWRRLIPAITERALSLHLKQLEEDGVLLRMVLYRKATPDGGLRTYRFRGKFITGINLNQ